MDASRWPDYKEEVMKVFKTRTQAEWCSIMEGTDVCFAPVLSIFEAPEHPHNKARNTFVEMDGVVQPAPSPRFSRTVAEVSHPARAPGADSESVLLDSGFTQDEVTSLRSAGVIG
jgi:alpha-methylacyl-CoA racemase